jgi:hypothetical protein
VCAVLLAAAPAGAVIGGTSDLDNVLENVGVLQLKVGPNWFDFCSGTLVAPDVVLTAAHCTRGRSAFGDLVDLVGDQACASRYASEPAGASGSVTTNVEPRPGCDSTEIVPPMRWTSSREM